VPSVVKVLDLLFIYFAFLRVSVSPCLRGGFGVGLRLRYTVPACLRGEILSFAAKSAKLAPIILQNGDLCELHELSSG